MQSLPHFVKIVLILGAVVVILGVTWVVQNGKSNERERVTFLLDKHTVAAGDSFRLSSTFYNIAADLIQRSGEVDIMNENGSNMVMKRYGFSMVPQNAGSGFVELSDAAYAGEFCPDGPSMPSGGRPLNRARIEETFGVLPDTPAGSYEIRIPANRFCEVNNPEVILKINVTR